MRLEGFSGQSTKDLTKVGAKVYAQDSNGVKYPGTVDGAQGYFSVKNIPLSKEPYDIVVEAPGHLKSIQKVNLGKKTTWGEDIGQYLFTAAKQPTAAAGDVNGDKMIDISDVIQVVAFYGEDHKKEDLNQDGIVDEKDVRFIEKNFLRVGPDAPKNKKPKEKHGNKGLEDFLRALGLEPINK